MPDDVRSVDASIRLNGPVSRLAKLTEKLTTVIEQETKLLQSSKPQEAIKLHGEKSRLIAEYREALNAVQVNQHLLGPEDSLTRKSLKMITDSFRAALREHARIVLRLKTVTEGIVKSVGQEIIHKRQPVMAYGKNASFNVPKQLPPTSLSLDQRI